MIKFIFVIFALLSFKIKSEEYWRPPIVGLKDLLSKEKFFNSNLHYLAQKDFTSVTVFLKKLGKLGYDITESSEYINEYYNDLEYISDAILHKNSHVVKQGEYKRSKDFLYTFYLNYCFALIINNTKNIIMLHGHPIGHPRFTDDLKKAKKILAKYKGDTYLISHQNKVLIREFKSDRTFLIANKPEHLIATLKAVKKNGNFEIKGEFHPNIGVKLSNYDKFIAHQPWGPMSTLKFNEYVNQ